jgi:hypothetical protein
MHCLFLQFSLNCLFNYILKNVCTLNHAKDRHERYIYIYIHTHLCFSKAQELKKETKIKKFGGLESFKIFLQ